MADKYHIELNFNEILFDPDSFGRNEIADFVKKSEANDVIKFYGFNAQLDRLKSRFHIFAANNNLKFKTTKAKYGGKRTITITYLGHQ